MMSPSSDEKTQVPPLLKRAELMHPWTERTPRLRGRWMVQPPAGGWDDYGLSEWELTGAGLSDHHPHDEVVFVLEGDLYVESGGTTVVAGVGDTVIVPAGSTGRYWAPQHARMISIYGPNAHGAPSHFVDYWEIDARDGLHAEQP